MLVAVASSAAELYRATNNQLVSPNTMVVHGDLHIASISMSKLAPAAVSSLPAPNTAPNEPHAIYLLNKQVHLLAVTTVICHDVIVNNINVSHRILGLLGAYPSLSAGWYSNTSTAACSATEITPPSISTFGSGLAIAGTLNASSLLWGGRRLSDWLDDVEEALFQTTAAPTMALRLTKQPYSISDSSSTPVSPSKY